MQETQGEVLVDKEVIFENNQIGIQFTSLHHIDHVSGKITKIDVNSKSKDLEEYIEHLMYDIQEKETKRYFEFKSNTTEVRRALGKLIIDDYEEAVNISANRLLDVEQRTQEKVKKLKVEILKGSLFQTIINVDKDNKLIIIGKADHNDFLDAKDFVLHMGLPWKKKIFKSFLAVINKYGEVTKVLVADSNNKISEYWWSDFFELKELRTNAHNTEHFLDIIDKKVLNPLRKEYKSDYLTLRYAAIAYFRNNSDFDFIDFFNSIFKNYLPKNDKFPSQKINDKVQKIPEKYSIDTQFKIDKDSIKKRVTDIVDLNEGMQLVLKGQPDLNKIKSYRDDDGDACISIKTEEGFKAFN